MNLLFDSFWRAMLDCMRPRVMVLSILPLVLMIGLSLSWGYYYWEGTLEWVRGALASYTLLNTLSDWLQRLGLGGLQSALAQLIVIFTVTPMIVILSLLAVSVLMTPALTSLVANKRFQTLQRKRGGSLLASLGWSLLSTLMALLALLVSIPLWLIPPLILILPPLIWGWLTYRVMAFDALAEHASAEERHELFRRHGASLMAIGVLCGFVGAAPSLVWASGALFAAAFVLLVPLAVWMYTLIFALSSLWFAHFCLAALRTLRAERDAVVETKAVLPTSVEAVVIDI